jgi:hypothetical protein
LLEVFRDLAVKGDNNLKLTTFVAALSKSLPAGWKRDRDRERELNRHSGNPPHYSFGIAAREGKPAAHLFLMQRGDDFVITNIVPDKVGELTRGQYNAFVLEFSAICAPVATKLGLNVHVTSDQLDISERLTARAMSALKSFSNNANMSTLHPLDSERWRKFLLLAHKDKVDLDAQILTRWLVEEWRWPEDRAFDLAVEYEFARELLDDYDESST